MGEKKDSKGERPNVNALRETYKVKSTRNYAMFRFIDGNRDTKHAEKIKKSIEAVGLLICPVLCNEKMEIIDGQGRFTACKDLNLPVYYVVQDGLGIEDVRKMNAVSTNWSSRNYVYSYAHGSDAREGYKYFENLQKQFPMFGDPILVSAIDGTFGGGYSKKLNSGELKVDEGDYLRAIASLTYLQKFVDDAERIEGKVSKLYASILFAHTCDSVNDERLLAQFHKRYTAIRPIATIKETLRDLEDIYNYNIRSPYEPVALQSEYMRYTRALSAKRRKEVNNAVT